MLRTGTIGLILGLSLLDTGCGTVCNFVNDSGQPKAFGGVPFDLEQIGKLTGDGPNPSGPLASSGAGGGSVAALLFLIVPFADIPFSFLGDILTYPLARWIDEQHGR